MSLRERAERKVADTHSRRTIAPAPAGSTLEHELLVQQVELEMQNEELQRALFELEEMRDRYFELFDLASDLGETRNLADAMPEKVQALDRLIDAFLRDTGARLPQPNPAFEEGAAGRP